MRPCIADIPAETNSFPDYDSYINCSRLIRLDAGHLYDWKGVACKETQANIITAVTAYPVLNILEIRVILEHDM